jgi:hypothetical protein
VRFAALVAVVVLLYRRLASVLLVGQVSQRAALAVEPPFLYRFLLSWTLGQVMPHAWLDSVALLTVVPAASVAACLTTFPAFAVRALRGTPMGLSRSRLWTSLTVVLVAHYGIPRPYCFWYGYDTRPSPSVYMVAFMAMTRQEARVSGWCVPLPALLSLTPN